GQLFGAGGERAGGEDESGKAQGHASCSGPKASGSRSLSVQLRAERAPAAWTSSMGANSKSTWRHAPQGGVGESASVATTMRRNRRAPAVTAAASAARSAQIVNPNDAFSMLHPM